MEQRDIIDKLNNIDEINFEDKFEEMCEIIDEANRIIDRELKSGKYNDPIELHGGPVRDWIDYLIKATAKQQVEEEEKLFDDLEEISRRHGDEKRSLVALVHEKDRRMKLVYGVQEYPEDSDLWFKYCFFIAPDPDYVEPKLTVKWNYIPLLNWTRNLEEGAAEKTINKQSNSEFKRFVRKRRK